MYSFPKLNINQLFIIFGIVASKEEIGDSLIEIYLDDFIKHFHFCLKSFSEESGQSYRSLFPRKMFSSKLKNHCFDITNFTV